MIRPARLLLVSAIIGALGAVAVATVAHADNCSSPGDCEETAGYTSIIAVVGGVAAVAAAAAAAAAAGGSAEGAAGGAAGAAGDGASDGGGDDGDDDEPSELVIIQVDPGEIEVGPDAPGRVTVTAWKSVDGKAPTRAGEVPLEISAASGSGLQLVPSAGTGEIIVTVSLVGPPPGESTTLTATGSAKGGSASAQVIVRFGEDYELELY